MVSMGLSAKRSSVESGPMSPLVDLSAAAPRQETVERLSIPAMQMGSVGALVVLGVLGSAGGAQAMVRRGAQCEAVDQLQLVLGDRGYDVGAVDGKFGGRTEAAVRRFQQQQNLLVDGIVGPATARAMGLPPEFSCSLVAAQSVQKPMAFPQQGAFAVATNGGALRLRQAPAGPVVGALQNGDRVTVIETADGWAKLRSGAWVSRAWLQVSRRAEVKLSQQPLPSQQPITQPVPAVVVSRVESPARAGKNAIAVPAETTLATAIPGQIIQLPMPQSAPVSPQAAVEAKVVVAPPKTGKISVSLPEAKPAAGMLESWAVDQVVTDETAVIRAVVSSGGEPQLKPQVAATVPTPVKISVNPVSSPSLDLEPGQRNSRGLLVAAASNSIALPSAVPPESTPPKAADLPHVVDPAATFALAEVVEVAEPTLLKSRLVEGQPEVEVALPVEEPGLVAVGYSSQPMEVATYGDRLLIRDQPGGEVIGSIPNGLQISTVGQKEGWYELETGGWVMARWLKE